MMEDRRLPSGIIASMAASAPHVSAAQRLSQRIAVSAATAGNPGTPLFQGNTGGLGNGVGLSNNTSTPLLGNGQPTPRELKRETFSAFFSGRYYTSGGRFTSQGTTYYYRGVGGSNMYLHGDFNMAIIMPASSSGVIQGEAVLEDKNTNSSGIQGFILTPTASSLDSQGRPTQFDFKADPNIYSGIFFVEAGQGTVSITYGPRKAATVRFDGLVFTNGLTNPLVNQDLYARGGRPLPNHVGRP
jgi:hypothetical protein